MKKVFFLVGLPLFLTVTVNAQLKVEANGDVVTNNLSAKNFFVSNLSFGTLNNGTSSAGTGNDDYVVNIQRDGFTYSTGYSGIHINVATVGNSDYKSIGLFSEAGRYAYGLSVPFSMGIGVRGVSKNFGYGVVGLQNGTIPVGAGIYGGIGSEEMPPDGGWYAGYFKGDVKVTGVVNGTTIGNSDIRFKMDIAELNTATSLSNILRMKPVEYQMMQQYVEAVTIDPVTRANVTKRYDVYDENSQQFQKKHFGLIAQDLQKLYPNLVYEVDTAGHLGINYTEIIPLLIESIKELNAKIEALQGNNPSVPITDPVISDPARSAAPAPTNTVDISASAPALFQNSPNPFSQATEIKYYLPDNVSTALLCIYNLQGTQLKQIALNRRGTGTHTLHANELTAGMYLYSLIADGNVIDTKKMTLTK